MLCKAESIKQGHEWEVGGWDRRVEMKVKITCDKEFVG